uniref:GyrI-like small molecule binding domain-containing protein n=1 Tax=Arcella intermedia TaxID=1963864 RepID=A0A6B2LHT6_9EUKA
MWLWLLSGILSIPLILLAYLSWTGFFIPVRLQITKTPRLLFLYKQHLGPYKKVGKAFSIIREKYLPHFGPGTSLAGLYFDSPACVLDEDRCRSCVGVLVREEEESKARAFMVGKPFLKLKSLPSTDSVLATSRLCGWVTYLTLGWRVYKPLLSYARKTKSLPEGCVPATLEVYNEGHQPALLEVYLPFGNDREEFNLSAYPKPPYKPDTSKKL